jgi:dihydroorotate dehydrogenase
LRTTQTNPQKIIDVFDQTAQAAASYLTVIKGSPEKEKQQALASTKQQLQDTLKVLDTAAAISPRQSLPLLNKVATEAKDAGASDIAQQAQKIIDTNSAVRTAAETAALSGKQDFQHI